jgi:hypothetical protein
MAKKARKAKSKKVTVRGKAKARAAYGKAKKVARAAAKRVKSAVKPEVRRSRRGQNHVSFGLHGMSNILQRIKDAGLEDDLNRSLQDNDDLFAKVSRTSLTNLKNYIDRKPELAQLSQDTSVCNCPPNDRYCIYLG